MELDVFTFVAQIFNFALLVFLLRRFLYKPVLTAMRNREELVANQLQTAADAREAARVRGEEVEAKLREIDETRAQMLADARHTADELGAQLTEALRARMAEREREWREEHERRTKEEMADFREAVGREIVGTVRIVLAELADESLEDRMTEVFIRKLDDLDPAEVERLSGDDDRPRLGVVTAFPLDPERAESLRDSLRARFGDGAQVSFDIDESRLAGLEVRCHGHRIGWSIAEYLESLSGSVADHLTQLTETDAPA